MCEIRRVCGKNVLNSANRTGMPFNRKTKKERQSRILNQMILCDYIRINMDKPYMPTYIDIDPKKVPLGWSLVTANFSRFCLFLFEHFSLFSKKKHFFSKSISFLFRRVFLNYFFRWVFRRKPGHIPWIDMAGPCRWNFLDPSWLFI